MTKHISGPWGYEINVKDKPGYGFRIFSIDELGEEYNQLICAPVYNEANAKLLTASPDLLGAAKELHELHMRDSEGLSSGTPSIKEWETATDNLFAAIEKAEGAES